jgi:hypothetical protein
MTVDELNNEDVDVIFKTMKAVLWSLLRAHGVDVQEVTLKGFEIKEIVDDGQGAGPRPICCTIDQNGEIVCFQC